MARGGCWLQDEACQGNVFRVLRFDVMDGVVKEKGGKRQAGTPRRRY